mmetsp:Transcript_3799/g.8439  ORF Transcript_3799/g.8439 Transcript_3799/m.8439 type:complete len:221 (-) Transcript_3799:581-1243(-)
MTLLWRIAPILAMWPGTRNSVERLQRLAARRCSAVRSAQVVATVTSTSVSPAPCHQSRCQTLALPLPPLVRPPRARKLLYPGLWPLLLDPTTSASRGFGSAFRRPRFRLLLTAWNVDSLMMGVVVRWSYTIATAKTMCAKTTSASVTLLCWTRRTIAVSTTTGVGQPLSSGPMAASVTMRSKFVRRASSAAHGTRDRICSVAEDQMVARASTFISCRIGF